MSYRDTVTKKKNAENRTYSQKALEKLAKGGYANEKKQTKEVPYVKPQVTSQRVKTTPVNTPKPTSNDENYVVKRDRYNKLMQDNRLANDIKTLATVNYSNANQDATVSQDWADTYGAKKITGGYTKQQFLDTLSRRYSLTPKELNDMALTFHSDATNAENERYGKELEQVGKKLPVLGSAGSFVGTLGSGIEGMYNTAVGGITGDDRYLSNMFRTTKNSPREGAKQNINSNIGKTIYDIGMGVGDMAAGAAAGSAPMLLAGNTANEAQASAMNRGSSVRKASAYAGAAGTVDYLTNTIGLEKAKKLAVNGIKSTGIKKILAQNAIAGAGEAGENLVQDIGQSFFDNLINGKNSELLYSYNNKKANGMSDEDAMKEVAKEYVAQLGVSAATGFGMGSAMQAGSTIAKNIPELKADLGQFNMDNRGQVDIDALFGRRPDLQELVNRDPGSFDTTELATFSAKKKDVASLLKQKNAEIRVQEGVHENATKKTKNAEYEKLAALKNEAEELKLEKKIYDYASKGKALPVKDRLPLDMYNSIYGRQTGLMNHIGYANKIAGDTPESKQLAREVKQLVTKLVETGNMDVYKELGTKAEQLNDLAKANNKEYKGATYDNYFTDFDDNGNPIEHNLVDYIVDNSGVSKAIQKFHLNNKADSTSVPIEVDPNNVIYHAGTLSRLNKADSAGKMEGMRDTGYYGTGHYFVDEAHKGEIGKGTSYGNKPYSSVDISKYNNLFKADNDAKANKLHSFSQKMMRFINGYNDKYYTDSEGIVPGELQEYMNDMYSDYKSLFGNKAMSQADFEDKLNDYRNNYVFDAEDRGDSAFTTFMKEHGYNGVDTRGTRSADTERGVVIYDLDEDSVLQSNVTDADTKNGLMNTRVRNDNPVFDTATDERIQKSLDSYSKKQQIKQEYERIFDSKELDKFESDIQDLKDEIKNIEENVIPYEEMMLEGGEGFEKEVDRTFREFKQFDPDVTREDIVELLRNNELERSNNIQNSRFKLNNLKQRLKEYQGIYDNLVKKSEAAYEQARENVEGTGDRALTPEEVAVLQDVVDGKYDIPENGNEVPRLQMTENETGRSSFFPPEVSRDVPPNNGMPHVDGTMPGDKSKTSKTYTNTGKRGGGWNEAEYEKYTDESMFQYEPKAEQESFQEGYNMWQKEGREGFKDRVMDKERLSGAEIDGLMIEWRILAREARALEEAGQDAGDAWKESIKVFRKIQTQSSDNAQALQALAKWSRNTPEGMLSEAENIVNGKTREKKSELQKELEKFGKRNRKFQFSEDFVKEFLKDAEEIQKYPADSPMANMLMAKLGRKVSRQIPVKFGEKLTSFLMDNMLGNFRTLITRNAGGNVGLNAVEQLAQRPLAAGIDALASKKTGKRTQAGLSTEGLAEYIQGFSKGLKDEARDLRTGLHTARTGENTLERAITANRHVFKEGGIMDKWDSLIKNGLSVGDRPFYEAVYKQTLGDYHRLRNAGLMGPDVQKLDNDQFKQYAQTAAKLNALAAVYQGDTTLSKALLGFKRDIGNLSEGIVGVDILSQFSMPFVKTPANVVDVGISYSPLGLVRNAFRTGRELANDNFDQNRFANETSRNILGTLGTIGAMGLAKNGILSGGYSDDADEKQAQKEAGEQEYALSLGDKQMDIGWLPVVGSNAVAAAATQDAIENGEGGLLQNAMEGLYAGGKAMFGQSMFQGLQRLFGTGEAYDSDTGIAGNMVNVVKSGIGQGIPSLARQVGQVIDPYQRDMGYSNADWEFGPFDNYDINSLVNNVPILRQNALAPKVNTSGELLKENQGRNVAMKVLEDMILPGKITKVEYSDLANEAMRLQAETNSADAYLPKAIRKNVDTDDYHLTNDEWVDYQQKYYKALTDVGTKIMQSESYQNADAETQTKTLKDAYDAVKSAINSEYNGKEVSGAAKKYVEAGGGKKGIDAVVNHFYAKQMMDDVGLSTSSNAGKEIAKAVESGDIKKAEELKEQAKNDTDYAKAIGYVDKEGNVRLSDYQKLIRKAGTQAKKMQNDLPVLHEMGLGNISHSVYHTYAEAIQKPANKNLDPREYATTFKKIDGADGTKPSESITQDELVAYFNKNNFSSEDQALKVWNVYAQGKKVPYLKKDGTWGTRMPK